jgi:hypothetical protein
MKLLFAVVIDREASGVGVISFYFLFLKW